MRSFTGTREQLDALLEGADHDGTWMDAQTAVKWGFCTGIMHNDDKGGVKQSVMHDIASMVLDAKRAKPSIISGDVTHIINKGVDANNGADIDNTSTAHDSTSIAQKILSMGVH